MWSIEVRTDNVATQNQGTKLVSQSDGNTGILSSFGNYVKRLYPNNSTETDTLTNLEITRSCELRARNDDTGEGTTLTSLSTLLMEKSICSVCINPRTLNTVHMAKITSADNEFIEFEPAFGKLEDTLNSQSLQVQIRQIRMLPCSLVLWVLNFDIFDDKPVIARPLFYFYEDRLDKVNEFNHNQKLRLVASRKNQTGLKAFYYSGRLQEESH